MEELIRAIRACKTAAEERTVIAKECALLRTAFKESEQDYRHRNVWKLMFIHMLGYPTHFGQMECLKLIASTGFPEKRIGYLGLMLLLDENQEVLMLVTNSIQNDLNHANQFVVGLALCSVANIGSVELVRDLAAEVEKLLSNSNTYIRKKSALCAVRIVRKVPDLVEHFIVPATGLLNDKHHGVLLAGVKLCTELCQISPLSLEHFRKQVHTLVAVLKNLLASGYAPEYDVGGINDPLLQIRVLRLLRLLGHGDAESSDMMSDILAQVATNTEGDKNAGNAILYECVLSIVGIESIGGLRTLAVNILGRFLSNADSNIRYVALNTLVRVVAVDTQAVQRHRATIAECVKESDVSIRKRALDLVYALVNDSNVEVLTKDLLEYLKISDAEFKLDLTGKLCSLVQKFAPSKQWYIDHMILIMMEPGIIVNDENLRSFVVLLSNAADLHGYSVRSFYRAMQHWSGQEDLAQIAVWCIGEYGEMLVLSGNELEGEDPLTMTESDTVDVIEFVLKDKRSNPNIQAYALTALLKLSYRFPSISPRIQELIQLYKANFTVELQQRSVEFDAILNRHGNLTGILVERMPVLDEAAYNSKKADRAGMLIPSDGRRSISPFGSLDSPPNGELKLGAANLPGFVNIDLSDIKIEVLPLPSAGGEQPAGIQTSTPPSDGEASGSTALEVVAISRKGSLMDDDFGVPVVSASTSGFSTIVAFESPGLKVLFDFTKLPSTPQNTVIRATYINLSSSLYTDFVSQAAVPKFLQLQLEPASGNSLPGNAGGIITQVINLTNAMHGQKSLLMKVRIMYKVDGRDVIEQGEVSNFPQGL